MRRGPWKLVIIEDSKPMLFNLEKDLGEQHDIAAQNQELVSELLESLDGWETEVEP